MQTGPRGQSRSLPRTLQLVGGGLLTLAGMSGTLIYPLTFGTLFLLALWYSPDHHLEPLTALRLAVLVFYLGFIALNAGTLILACLDRSFCQRLGRVLWTDAGCPESRGWRALPWLLLPTAVALLLIISWVVARWVQWYPLVLQYGEDGPFEDSTAAALVLAAVVLAWAAFSLWRMAAAQPGSAYRWSFWVCIGLMAAAFVVGMEEISWGQRVLGWQTPAALGQLNYQNETNLHNLFNPVLRFLYVLPAALIFPVFAGAWVRIWRPTSPLRWPILPHPSLIILTVFLGFAGVVGESELLEELGALWMLAFSLGIARRVACQSRGMASDQPG